MYPGVEMTPTSQIKEKMNACSKELKSAYDHHNIDQLKTHNLFEF